MLLIIYCKSSVTMCDAQNVVHVRNIKYVTKAYPTINISGVLGVNFFHIIFSNRKDEDQLVNVVFLFVCLVFYAAFLCFYFGNHKATWKNFFWICVCVLVSECLFFSLLYFFMFISIYSYIFHAFSYWVRGGKTTGKTEKFPGKNFFFFLIFFSTSSFYVYLICSLVT